MKTQNLDALTGLRGIAAWLVVLYHFREYLPHQIPQALRSPIDLGYLAVDLFFVLSGVVLYLNYHAAFERLTPRGYIGFQYRRIARVYPLHLVVMLMFLLNPLAIALFSSQGDIGVRYDVGYYILSLLLVQNWGFTQSIAWNIPAWSISAEFGAYLLFPLMVIVVKRLARGGVPALIGALLALALGLWALFAGSGLASLGDDIARLGLLRCLLEFSMGLVLGHLWVFQRRSIELASPACLLAALLGLLAVILAGDLPDHLVAPALFCLLVTALLDQRRAWSRVLSIKPLIFLGEISYSTYLIHYFVKDWVKFLSPQIGWAQWLIYIVAVLLLSVVLYRHVELPFRQRLYALLSRPLEGARIAQ